MTQWITELKQAKRTTSTITGNPYIYEDWKIKTTPANLILNHDNANRVEGVNWYVSRCEQPLFQYGPKITLGGILRTGNNVPSLLSSLIWVYYFAVFTNNFSTVFFSLILQFQEFLVQKDKYYKWLHFCSRTRNIH